MMKYKIISHAELFFSYSEYLQMEFLMMLRYI